MTQLGCSSEHTQALFAAMGEKADWCRIFAQDQNWSTTATPWKTAIAADARGEKVALSFKGDPKVVASGGQDGRIAGIANGLKAANIRNGVLIFYHEPEDNVEAGTFTAADWRKAQVRYMSVARPILAPLGWRFAPCLMGWTINPTSGRNIEDYWVPEADMYTWDVYNFSGASDGSAPYATKDPSTTDPVRIYGPAAAWSKSKGKPFAICETGCTRRQADTKGVERTKWLKMATDAHLLEGYEFVCYYENGVPDGRAEVAIRTEPDSMAQFSKWRTTVVVPPEPPIPPEPTDCSEVEAELAQAKIELANQEQANDDLITELSKTQAERDAALERLAQIHTLSA